jgi:hypothetical protein
VEFLESLTSLQVENLLYCRPEAIGKSDEIGKKGNSIVRMVSKPSVVECQRLGACS